MGVWLCISKSIDVEIHNLSPCSDIAHGIITIIDGAELRAAFIMDGGVTQWPANIGIFVMYPAMPVADLRSGGKDGGHFFIGRVVAEGIRIFHLTNYFNLIAVIHNLSLNLSRPLAVDTLSSQ